MATIKYYLREGLVPPGEATAPNQADYGDAHERRLRLVRVLREIGDLSIEAIREVVDAVENEALSQHQLLGVAHRAISPFAADDDAEGLTEVDGLLERLGWRVSADAPDRYGLARALTSLRALGREVDADAFVPYARAVDPIAEMEIAGLSADQPPEAAVEYAVVGTVVYGAALAALRRLAQEHHSARRSGG